MASELIGQCGVRGQFGHRFTALAVAGQLTEDRQRES
jgi:hypothetical protein